MRFPIKTTVLLTLLLAQVGCATKDSNQRPPTSRLVPERKPTVIGNISLVNPKVGFVLIKSKGIPPAGTVLKSLAEDESVASTLKVTFERQPPFIIADILHGNPYPGQPVVIAEMPKATQNRVPIVPVPTIPSGGGGSLPPAPAPAPAPVQAPIEAVEVTPEFIPVELPAEGMPAQ